MSQHAKAVIRDAVLGRKDAGLPFTTGCFYNQERRAACALGACGLDNETAAVKELGVTYTWIASFTLGFDGEKLVLNDDAYAFGREMAMLAFDGKPPWA